MQLKPGRFDYTTAETSIAAVKYSGLAWCNGSLWQIKINNIMAIGCFAQRTMLIWLAITVLASHGNRQFGACFVYPVDLLHLLIVFHHLHPLH